MRKAWQKSDDKRILTGRPWRRLREQVLARDLYTCQVCKLISDQLEVDHIIPLSKGGDDSMLNLQTLCSICHERKTLCLQ